MGAEVSIDYMYFRYIPSILMKVVWISTHVAIIRATPKRGNIEIISIQYVWLANTEITSSNAQPTRSSAISTHLLPDMHRTPDSHIEAHLTKWSTRHRPRYRHVLTAFFCGPSQGCTRERGQMSQASRSLEEAHHFNQALSRAH